MSEKNNSQDIEMVPEETGDEADPAATIKKLRERLTRCEAEKGEYLTGWQRAKADLINYKKDEAKRFEEVAKFSAEGLIAETVQVLDSFDLALQHEVPREIERGIVLIRSQLEDILRRHGLEMLAATGKKFEPALHESIGEVEAEVAEGTVVEELQKGYLLHGKVLRPARVKISRLRHQRPNSDHK